MGWPESRVAPKRHQRLGSAAHSTLVRLLTGKIRSEGAMPPGRRIWEPDPNRRLVACWSYDRPKGAV